jgi:multidrug efflux pump subunit AcrA (membrane-fusion protein)
MRFRRQALRHLEQPENLDRVARLTTVPSWLLTVALVVTVLAAGAWTGTATLDREVTAGGVLIHPHGVSDFDAAETGRVVKVWADRNEPVAKGTPIYSVQDDSGGIVTVPAPWDAYVVSLLIAEGQVIERGARVAELERLDAPGDALQAVLFVSAASAPMLSAGQPVHVDVAAVSTTVFGTLQGEVGTVGAFPETEDSLRAFLGSGRDVRPFLADGSVVRVVVLLHTDPESPTGLLWSKASPPFRLTSISEVDGRIVVGRDRPLDWVLGR